MSELETISNVNQVLVAHQVTTSRALVVAMPVTSRLAFAFPPTKAAPALNSKRARPDRVTPSCRLASPSRRRILSAGAALALLAATPSLADDADLRPKLKVSGGSASTSGGASGAKTVVKTVTRGVNLEGADFSGGSFEGVSFQQSILRQADFSGAQLRDASFFDADLSGAKFRGADLRGVNVCIASLAYGTNMFRAEDRH